LQNELTTNNFDLALLYTRLFDVCGELNYNQLPYHYVMLNEYIKEIEAKTNGIILVVSDHGIEQFENSNYGKHSDYGFYSINKNLDWKPTSVLSFYKYIRSFLKEN
jgi:hypothetical protein